MFLLNSCLGPLLCDQILLWHPFSLSYGVNLPSSLTMLLSLILGSLLIYLCRFAVRAPLYNSYKLFSRQCASWKFVTYFFTISFRYESFLFLAFLPLLCPLHFLSISVVQEFLPAVHQIRLSASSLGPDFYPGRTNLPQETLDFDGKDSHLFPATYSSILSVSSTQCFLLLASSPIQNAPFYYSTPLTIIYTFFLFRIHC